MKEQKDPLLPLTIPRIAASSSGGLKRQLRRYIYHWPLFLICVTLCCAGLYVFNKTTTQSYEIRAQILIQDQRKMDVAKSVLHEIDPASISRLVENELEILKSKKLISKTITKLNLTTSYMMETDFGWQDLYGVSPFVLSNTNFDKTISTTHLEVTIIDQNSFILNLKGKEFKAAFNQSLITELGAFRLRPTKFTNQYIGKTIDVDIMDPNQLAVIYQARISTSVSSRTSSIITLSLVDNVPQRGQAVLDQLLAEYRLATNMEKQKSNQNTLNLIKHRLDSLGRDLSKSEKAIATFKSTSKLTDISSKSRISLESLQSNDSKINDINVKLGVINGIEKYVTSESEQTDVPATLGINEPSLNSAIEKLQLLNLEREGLLTSTPESNPEFEPINSQIKFIKATIKQNIKNIKSSLLNSLEKLNTINLKIENDVKELPTQERQYIDIKRQQEIKESLYTYLMQKHEATAINFSDQSTEDYVVDNAYIVGPAGPKKKLIFVWAILIAFAIPAGVIQLRSIFSSKVLEPADISNVLTIPIMSELPLEPGDNRTLKPGQLKGVNAEVFRTLRIRLSQAIQTDNSAKVILVTSSVAGEGKSLVASRLAASFASSRQKTILIDLDLRKPQISRIFGLSEPHPGAIEFLDGRESATDIIQGSGYNEMLDIISSGVRDGDPWETLEKSYLSNLIEDLKKRYDTIVIDSPPVHLVPDAFLITSFSNITLYIIRQGYTEKEELEYIDTLNDQHQINNLAIVLNGVNHRKYGSGYSYDSKYYGDNPGIIENVFGNFSRRF